MRSIGFFAELGYQDGSSIADAVGRCPPSLRSAVAEYLESGSALIVASSWVDDVLEPTLTRIAQEGVYTDGDRIWPHALAYYVREYGVDVPTDLLELVRSGAKARVLAESELLSVLEEQAAGTAE